WLTSVWPLMTRLSAARTRPDASAAAVCVGAMALSFGPGAPPRAAASWPDGVVVCVAGVSSQFSMIRASSIRLLASFAFFEAFVAWTHGADGAHDFGFRQCRHGRCAG